MIQRWSEMETIEIDGQIYDMKDLSEEAANQLQNLQFVNEQILQRNNELQVALTAKIGYSRALQRELAKIPD